MCLCECAFVKVSPITAVYPRAMFLKIPPTGQLHLLSALQSDCHLSLSRSQILSFHISAFHLSLFKSLLCDLSEPPFPSPLLSLLLLPRSLSNLARHLSGCWHGTIKRRPWHFGIGAPLLTANNSEWLMRRRLSEQISDEATDPCEWSSLF